MLIETPPPMVNLFARAREAMGRSDWKLAIDSLQRIIDDPQGALVPADTDVVRPFQGDVPARRYESARRRAHRMLATMEPAGLRAYRVLHDGKAKGLVERARVAHDLALLRSVVDHYLLTRYGDDAADLLTSWLLDRGARGTSEADEHDLFEVIAVLSELTALVPDADVPEARIVGKLAVAQTLLGQAEEAAVVVADFRRRSAARAVRDPADEQNRADFPPWLATLGDAGATPLAPADASFETDGDRAPRAMMKPALRSPSPWRADLGPLPGASAARALRLPVLELGADTESPDPAGWAAEPCADRAAWEDDPDAPTPLPSGRVIPFESHASDGAGRRTLLLVETPTGCAALDADDLSTVWHWPRATAGSADRRTGDGADFRQAWSILGSGRTAGAGASRSFLSLAGELVLRVAAAPLVPQPSERAVGGREVGSAGGVSLIALEAASGTLRWRRDLATILGREAGVDPAALDLTLQGAPFAVRDKLWWILRMQGDLALVVLDPADGSVIRTRVFGAVASTRRSRGSGEVGVHAAQTPIRVGRVVYIPTGRGVVFALDAEDGAPIWATRYERGDARASWCSDSTPLLRGGLLLLAPRDAGALLAITTGTGQIRWSQPVDRGSYVLAADARRVWIAGRGLQCLSLFDGEVLWERRLDSPVTGRAAHASIGRGAAGVLYVPTREALELLDAATGRSVASILHPPALAPLGNVRLRPDALLSVDAGSIRSFADLELAYETATRRLQENSSDRRLALRLGWLELLRGATEAAMQRVDGLRSSRPGGREADDAGLARLRVEVLLTEAREEGISSERALELLEQAASAARDPSNQLRCGLLVAEQLVSQGKAEEAYRRLWSLGLSPDADRFTLVGDGVSAPARLVIEQRLRGTALLLTEAEVTTLGEALRNRVEALRRRLGDPAVRAALRAAAVLRTIGSARQDALLALAEWARRRGQQELAEQHLLECLRSATDSAPTIAALMHLCVLYAESALVAPLRLERRLAELRTRFGGQPVPDGAAPVGSSPSEPGQTISEWVQAMETSSRPAAAPETSKGSRGGDAAHLVLGEEPAWRIEDIGRRDPIQLVDFGAMPPEVLRNRLVLHEPGGVLQCVEAESGALVWKSSLIPPEAFFTSSEPQARVFPTLRRRAVADGQIAIVRRRDGLFAVGLESGRRLWARPVVTLEPDVEATANRMWQALAPGLGIGPPGERDGAQPAAAAGVVAAALAPGHLTLMRVVDGTTIWDRDLCGESIGWIRMVDGGASPAEDRDEDARVLVADETLQRVYLLRRGDGSLVERVMFRQPDPGVRPVALLLSSAGGVPASASSGVGLEDRTYLIGPDTGVDTDAILAVDARTGEKAWRTILDKPLGQLLDPAGRSGGPKGYAVAVLVAGETRLFEVATGRVVMRCIIPTTHLVLSVLLLDDILLIEHLAGQRGRRYPELSAYDRTTGERLWHRADLAWVERVEQPLRLVGGLIPVVLEPRPVRGQGTVRPKLALLDATTGEAVGPTLRLSDPNSRIRPVGDVAIGAGTMVIGTSAGVVGFRLKPATAAAVGEE